MKKYLFFAAALVAFASCSDDTFVAENSPNMGGETGDGGTIVFNSGAKTITRADHVGADAASLLDGKFIVGGFKGTYTTGQDLQNVTVETGKVFDNYIVRWGANTAGTTTDNTSDWKYVGIPAAAPSGIAGNNQSIKYWDYSASQYDFIAYSTGNATITTTGTAAEAIAANKVLVTAITPTTAKTSAYQLSGKAEHLEKCYIADMVTVYKDGTDGMHYQDEVTLTFRNLASKVRMAIYETVPGYSVKDVKFYSDASTTIVAGTSNEHATLFTTGSDTKDHFYTAGTYTVKFPTIGKSNASPKASDYNKAHASFAVVGAGQATTKDFGTLQKVGPDYREASGSNYIGRTATTASFAGTTAPYYQIAMPNEEGTVLELRVDYTLLSIDGSGEEIKVHGARAFVPAIYAQWKSNYAYTYLFKISDNSNGWTSTVETDPAGLYPITFDAIVMETEDYTQSTITNVATPSITTYQKDHVYNVADPGAEEYSAAVGNIYIQVMNDGTLATNLTASGISKLYTLSGKTKYTEADVLDALNLQESATSSVITGRNGVSLTQASITNNIHAIPGPDGNDITVNEGEAAMFDPDAGTYAYVYDTNTYGGAYYTSAPADIATVNKYYSDPQCTTNVTSWTSACYLYQKDPTYIYSAVHFDNGASEPGDWSGNYWDNPDGTGSAVTTFDSTPAEGVTYYRRYTVNHKIYGVKVIKVKA